MRIAVGLLMCLGAMSAALATDPPSQNPSPAAAPTSSAPAATPTPATPATAPPATKTTCRTSEQMAVVTQNSKDFAAEMERPNGNRTEH